MIKKVQFQYLKVFLFFIILFFSFTSCKNLLITENCKEKQKAYIKISTNQLDNSTRTFLPNGFNEESFLIKWILTINSENGDNPLEYTWEDKNDEEATISAYSQMITDTSIELEVGTWTFNLVACNPYTDSTYLEATITKELKDGENILFFNMEEASGENAAEGNIEFTLYWKNNSYVNSVNYTLYKWDNTTKIFEETETTGYFSNNYFEKSEDYPEFTYCRFCENRTFPTGYYMLKMEIESNWKYDYKIINTYTCILKVSPGLLTSGSFKLLNELYTINYIDDNEIITTFEEDIVDTVYNQFTSFYLPTPIKEGYIFEGWYTDASFTNQVNLDENNKFRITEDTNLFANWIKVPEGITLLETDGLQQHTFEISSEEGLATFRNLVNDTFDESMIIYDETKDNFITFDGLSSNNYRRALNAKLSEDINLTQLTDEMGNELSWVSIDNYWGTFDGNGHKIIVNKTYTQYLDVDGNTIIRQGLFSSLDGATIKNLTLEGNETILNSEEITNCGGIVAEIRNTRSKNTVFENCINKRNITMTNGAKVGGFAGYSSGEQTTFTNCVNIGNINIESTSNYAPCFSGFTTGATSYTKCINIGDIKGAVQEVEGNVFGSVTGFDNGSSVTFTDCINFGNISVNTIDGEKITDKIYGFSGIDEYNAPNFYNCIDMGSSNYPFTNIDINQTGTKTNSYYCLENYEELNFGFTGKTITELFTLRQTELSSDWLIQDSYYPLPNIGNTLPNDVWQIILEKAQPKEGTSINPFTTWKQLKDYVYEESTKKSTVYISGTLEATEMVYVKRPVTIMSTGTSTTIKRINGCTNLFQINAEKSLTIKGTSENNIVIDGGNTSETPLEIVYPLLQVAQQGGEIILEHCTLQNSNCGSDSYGAILYASSETSVSMKNCEIKSNIGKAIVLSSALSANFTDCTFEDNTDNDICVISCPNLCLAGNMELPSLYFSNDYTNATLTIQVAENLQGNICFDAFNYENVSIFNEGITLPDNVFSLKNEEYILGTNGTISKYQ